MLSYGDPEPVTAVAEPSYFAVYVALTAVPSVLSPVLVTFTPPGASSRTDVRLFTGNGAGVYLDFVVLTFQVPMELSAPKAATAVIAKTTRARLNGLRMFDSPFEIGLTCRKTPFVSQWCRFVAVYGVRLVENATRRSPKQHPLRSAMGLDATTDGTLPSCRIAISSRSRVADVVYFPLFSGLANR